MKKIICKVPQKGVHAFFYVDGVNEYWLFNQDFRKSIKSIFAKGVNINELSNIKSFSYAVNRTLDKLPAYIKYIETEYNIAIYNKTIKKQEKRRTEYKRQKFLWKTIDWEMVSCN